jgi:hypothetical protein
MLPKHPEISFVETTRVLVLAVESVEPEVSLRSAREALKNCPNGGSIGGT